MRSPLAREEGRHEGLIQPCQPTLATQVRTGPDRVGSELKHDGMRLIARKDGARAFVEPVRAPPDERLRCDRCGPVGAPLDEVLLDGEGLAHCAAGLPDFNRTLSTAGQQEACLIAFDLLMVNGEDLRPLPLLTRRKRLHALLEAAGPALRFTWKARTARPCSVMRAGLGWKASCRRT
jgi:bifunctional non-homologous end joining protein LigD